MTPAVDFLDIGQGELSRRIAVRMRNGAAPGLVWLGGFMSDMGGTKAVALDQWAGAQGRACLRFDYSGHGESGGRFADGDHQPLARGEPCRVRRPLRGAPDRGGLVHGRVARAPARARAAPGGRDAKAALAGLILIAPAVDFTEALMWQRFPEEIKREIETTGAWKRPSQYSDQPYLITKGLIEDGRRHLLLGGLIETGCPVRILQGVQDPDVPWDHAVELVSRLAQDDVVLTLVKDGDHRLSRPEDIERLLAAVAEF